MNESDFSVTRRGWIAGAAALVALHGLNGAELGSDALLPPRYRPGQPVQGTLRIWGHGSYGNRVDFIERLVRNWEGGFRQFHPQVRLDIRLYGTASAIGALYTGTGDLALMGREIWGNETVGFREVRGYDPTGVDVVTGSFDVRNRGYALVVFVHRSNPLRGLNLTDLARIFAASPPAGQQRARLWGDVGLGGEWAARPINVYGLPIARGFAEYF
jgi:phosphate transport system substrate-binding protein